jgi:hypothetical protein
MSERVGYVRIKPRRNAPGTYLTLNIKFVQGAWYELPEHILHPDTGERFPILEALSRITDSEERPVFDVLPLAQARALQEKEQSAELERLLAARTVVASGVADVDRPVRPTVQVPPAAPGTELRPVTRVETTPAPPPPAPETTPALPPPPETPAAPAVTPQADPPKPADPKPADPKPESKAPEDKRGRGR